MQPAAKASAPVSGKTEVLNQQTIDVTFTLFGYEVNVLALAMALTAFGILMLFWRIQTSKKLDFADMITKDGRAVSLTKILQLVGGITATWIMVKLTLTGGLTEAVLGIYLAYVGGIEGYSKFISAKYKYSESSVQDRYNPDDFDNVRRPAGNYYRPPYNEYGYDVRSRDKKQPEVDNISPDDPSLKPPKV